jgi:hypothetical protein
MEKTPSGMVYVGIYTKLKVWKAKTHIIRIVLPKKWK